MRDEVGGHPGCVRCLGSERGLRGLPDEARIGRPIPVREPLRPQALLLGETRQGIGQDTIADGDVKLVGEVGALGHERRVHLARREASADRQLREARDEREAVQDEHLRQQPLPAPREAVGADDEGIEPAVPGVDDTEGVGREGELQPAAEKRRHEEREDDRRRNVPETPHHASRRDTGRV